MNVAAIVGTRPEVIKLAPVVHALRSTPGTQCAVVSTGQHREMLDQMLEVFELEPDIDLAVMRHRQRLPTLTANLIHGLGKMLAALRPEWALVQGDTTTTFSGALAAFYEGIPVAHVEAGLRTGDSRTPFPEETNRRLVGRLATLHFCPTPRNADNLHREGVPENRVLVTGNTVIDALLWAVERSRRLRPPTEKRRRHRILLTVHRRENHGPPLRQVCSAVRHIAARGDVDIVFPVHRSPSVSGIVGPALAHVSGVHLCDPLDYLSLVRELDACDLVLSDSGGLQEEAPALGKPVLVLRDATERPEAVEAGVARLVGTTPEVIVGAVSALLDDPVAYAAMARASSPFGDGRARLRVVEALGRWHPSHEAA
ncbi:MAG TPA: UDP-N-acetylglucosamine 2-epimerase (non-hydrolyzing) [Gaiellaceae bacterium]|nr:UDP-N-acetylglucosamine 2-epimerase (non-hydrolyzing) [Gaiellaceae bacterium]